MTISQAPSAEQNQQRREAIAKPIQACKLSQRKAEAAARQANAVHALRAPIENLTVKDPAASHALEALPHHRFVNLPPFVDNLRVLQLSRCHPSSATHHTGGTL
jgi:hypothetical protein